LNTKTSKITKTTKTPSLSQRSSFCGPFVVFVIFEVFVSPWRSWCSWWFEKGTARFAVLSEPGAFVWFVDRFLRAAYATAENLG